MEQISETAWNATPLVGRNLSANTLAGEVGEAPTLLVFLRHLG